MDRDEELPISVRLAMCPAERERDASGCRSSGIGLTPELIGPGGVLVVVPPLMFPPPIRLRALVGPTGGATSNTSPLPFPGFPSQVSSSPAVVVTKKLWGG